MAGKLSEGSWESPGRGLYVGIGPRPLGKVREKEEGGQSLPLPNISFPFGDHVVLGEEGCEDEFSLALHLASRRLPDLIPAPKRPIAPRLPLRSAEPLSSPLPHTSQPSSVGHD